MGNTCRYAVNALGKGGETYYTKCKDKQELTKWIANNQEKLLMEELKIVDKYRIPFLNRFYLGKLYK
jgi:hypothetical protein